MNIDVFRIATAAALAAVAVVISEPAIAENYVEIRPARGPNGGWGSSFFENLYSALKQRK